MPSYQLQAWPLSAASHACPHLQVGEVRLDVKKGCPDGGL